MAYRISRASLRLVLELVRPGVLVNLIEGYLWESLPHLLYSLFSPPPSESRLVILERSGTDYSFKCSAKDTDCAVDGLGRSKFRQIDHYPPLAFISVSPTY